MRSAVFHGLIAVAPLKHIITVRPSEACYGFPRPNSRGPIEANTLGTAVIPVKDCFPRPNSRGPIEACRAAVQGLPDVLFSTA